jgi:hypothetical protein
MVIVLSSSTVDRGFERSLKQQFADRYVAPFVILIPRQPVFALSP